MSNTKKKNGLFKTSIVLTSVFLVTAIGLTVASTALKSIANTYLGKGEAHIVEVEGSDQWDTNYYDVKAKSKAEAVENGEKITKELCDEGFVLMKNKNDALPLKASSTSISLVGRGAVDPLYGGSGSGNVDASKAATPYTGIRQAGFTMDDNSYNYFNKEKANYQRCSIRMDKYNQSQWLIGEVAYNDATGADKPFTVVDGVAVYVISRAGGEGWDLSNDLKKDASESEAFAEAVKSGTSKAEYDTYKDGQHQLELSEYEKNWIKFCEKNYKKTIVVINSSNAMELGELEKDDGVDAVLWVGGPGSTGFNALGDILAGKVNPSGKTADIYAADFTKDPTFVNANRAISYTDIGAGDVSGGDSKREEAYLTQYEEGIYIGYRYYETAAVEGVIDYDASVVYPFGYGLSYTTFSKESTWSENADGVTVKVKVTNTGSVAGKEAVQLYYSAPYTKGGIEKSAVVLGDFGKTKLLAPGESDTVEMTILKKDMASYDYKGIHIQGGGYILENGSYEFTVRENSHVVSEGASNKKSYNFSEIKYTTETRKEVSDMVIVMQPATNRFNDVSAMFTDTKKEGYALNMSRADFKATAPTAPTAKDRLAKNIVLNYEENGVQVSKTVADLLKPYVASEHNNAEDKMPVMGQDNGLVLSNMRGKNYIDPVWDTFLDQLTEEDYKAVGLGKCAYNTPAVESIGKVDTKDFDGPQGFSKLWGSTGCCAYCSEVVIASTFNKDLVREMGRAIGEEAMNYEENGVAARISGWYGPALNTHRTPFAGRNFEYYSEDPMLTGKIACEVIEGAAEKGLYAYLKHFALNDTEVFRTVNQCTWATEQTMREIYLKGFQYVVENATMTVKYIADENGTVATNVMPATTAVMSSFNRIGAIWAGGSKALMTDVLRGEWGFCGVGLTDFNLYDYMIADQGTRAGTDLHLSFGKTYTDESATAKLAIRQAYKNMCYTVANSNAMQGVAPGTIVVYDLAWWQIAVYVFDAVAAVIVLAGAAYIVYYCVKNKKS